MRAPFGWTKAFSIQVKGHPLSQKAPKFFLKIHLIIYLRKKHLQH